MHPPVGRATSPMARRISGRWYTLPDNPRGLRAVALDLGRAPALLVRTAAGETRTPIGFGTWPAPSAGWANGIETMLSVAPHPAISASGAWASDSVFSLRLVAPETPFYSTMRFTFSGDRLVLDGEQNVSFGTRELGRLEGRR
jgi:hypothetical protein